MKRKIVIATEETEQGPSKKVKGDTNFLTGKHYSENYFKLLETRKKLPAY